MMEFQVSGMTCGHCVAAVERAVREVPGVASVTVDLEHGLVQVDGAPDPAVVRLAVEDEGYAVR